MSIRIKAQKAQIFQPYTAVSADLDMYTEEGVFGYMDSDEISSAEEGFMMGYLSA